MIKQVTPKRSNRRTSQIQVMRKFGLLLFVLVLIIGKANAQRSDVWMVGPMLHFNFCEKKMHTSFAIEVSYWNYEKFPYSFDGGIEFEKGKFRLYSEAQTGIAVLGLSLGPVLEHQKAESRWKLGVQTSVWANYFGGVDLRYRNVGGTSAFSPGIYFKLPLGTGDLDGEYHHWDFDD